ncbi:MAG: ribulose-phosphate 3-epimerase [Myxococcales bacterium]|nr:ribulose-phosphate 3-epimerase [Myxococcales bacterium]HIK85392.1 ribulose-phosphate 3-epimerase [Myxococcales bacterium]
MTQTPSKYDSSEILISPSILAADFANLTSELRSIESADLIHVDVMDGHFVPNLTIGPPVIKAIKKIATRPLDVHLMIESPETYLEHYIDAGADILGVHVEACPHLHGTLGEIRKIGTEKNRVVRSCAVLNPATPAESLEYALDEADQILVMTVNPGFGGQSFIEAMLPKIEKIRGWIESRGLDIDLEVDGGVTQDNIALAASAGANLFVAGTAIFAKDDRKLAIEDLRAAARKADR